jgi:hypothetical protein
MAGNVVHNLVHILGRFGTEDLGLCCKEVLQRALGALDLARQHRLFADIHEYKQVWIGERLDRAIEPPQGDIGIG